jgi:hypothetical protein
MHLWKISTLAIAASLAIGADARAAPQRWTRVKTAAGFSVDQPVGWQAVSANPLGSLGIVSGRCRAPVVVVCSGEAMIVVSSEPIVAKPTALRSKACWSMEESRTETETYPGSRMESTELSCAIGDRRFRVLEHHWKGDKHAASYGRIAVRMAKSLRYPG